MHYCDHALSVVRPSVVNFSHFRLLLWSHCTESTKLDRKQDLNVLYQVCAFQADLKNKMAALASDWLRHFRLLLWNHWTEFKETWQEARSQRPLPCLCFSGGSVNKNVQLGRFLKKVAHCTQVHDMWPFGPLVWCWLNSLNAEYHGFSSTRAFSWTRAPPNVLVTQFLCRLRSIATHSSICFG